MNAFPNDAVCQSNIANIFGSVGWKTTFDNEKSPCTKHKLSSSDFVGWFKGNQ